MDVGTLKQCDEAGRVVERFFFQIGRVQRDIDGWRFVQHRVEWFGVHLGVPLERGGRESYRSLAKQEAQRELVALNCGLQVFS